MSALKSFDRHVCDLMATAEVLKPDGPGPFPAVIQFHGCGGRKSFQSDWADVARQAGVAAVVVDSFAHRGISRTQAYCMVCFGLRLQGWERAGDVYAALAWTRAQSWADPGRIALAGWSHGGWSILDALTLAPGAQRARATRLADSPEAALAGVAGAFLVYPYVGLGCLARRQPIVHDARILALVGAWDSVVGARGAKRALERMRLPHGKVQVEWLERCTHAFDEIGARDPRTRHNPEQTAHARRLYRAFLTDLFNLPP